MPVRHDGAVTTGGVASLARLDTGRDHAMTPTRGEITMSKFMILYRSSVSAREQVASAIPEQQHAGMEAWRHGRRRPATPSPTSARHSPTTHVGPGTAGTDEVTRYSILNAGSADEVEIPLDGHPHLTMPGASIEVLELIPIGDL
jgi:hypothetical protein